MKLNRTKKNTIVTFFTILMMMFVFTSFVMPVVASNELEQINITFVPNNWIYLLLIGIISTIIIAIIAAIVLKKKNKMIRKFSIFFLIFLLLIQPIHALEITPENSIAGDEVVISGTASPGESVELTIIFEKRIPVIDGRYSHTFEGIRIPDANNVFTVTSKSVRDLTVAVRLLMVWIPVSSNAVNNVATISQANVPAGTYTIRIHGNAAPYETHVDLTISASTVTIADSNGNFEFRHSTDGIPHETFDIRVGNVERTVTLHREYIPQTPHPAGGGGACGGRIVGDENRLPDVTTENQKVEIINETILEENQKVEIINETILEENQKVEIINETILEENQKVEIINETILEENQKVEIINETILEENQKVEEPNEKKLNLLYQILVSLLSSLYF